MKTNRPELPRYRVKAMLPFTSLRRYLVARESATHAPPVVLALPPTTATRFAIGRIVIFTIYVVWKILLVLSFREEDKYS